MTAFNKQWADHIHEGAINQAIAAWHAKRPERVQDCATPSTMTDCPRVVWLRYKKNVPPPIPLGWGKAQRMLQGRVFENIIADQLRESGNLLYHWKDDFEGESVKFEMGEGETRICGTPDLLLKIGDTVYISDAKTSMGKSFGYIPLDAQTAFKDYMWFKYQLQVEAYYMLCHKNKDWFEGEGVMGHADNMDMQIIRKALPLPAACHLFSYALDDGVNRREFMWKATQETASKVLYYTKRWNRAFASETMPECTCEEFEGTPRKFCYYVQEQQATQTGYKLGTKCCGEELYVDNKSET